MPDKQKAGDVLPAVELETFQSFDVAKWLWGEVHVALNRESERALDRFEFGEHEVPHSFSRLTTNPKKRTSLSVASPSVSTTSS